MFQGKGFEVKLDAEFPPDPVFDPQYRRAPHRGLNLTPSEITLAVKNALRYVPSEWHSRLAPEFLEELLTRGRIYAYRFRPQGRIWGRPIDEYKGITPARGIQVMIDNNLDFEVALYPYELVTYGESGQVCQNWMQYRLIKKYLEIMTEEQTLVVQSGHPLGLFPSRKEAPRVISTNGIVIGKWDNPEDFQRLTALGVANYGQMTAGGWMYIGPQGIVHGTYITLLNAGRKYLGIPPEKDLRGVLFISSGLGGMSGAQPKAVEIAKGIGVIAEVDYSRIETRLKQGWVKKVSSNLDEIFQWVDEHRKTKEPISIAYYGNIVDLLEYVDSHNIKAELLSDQTSCHAVYEGGYTPVGLTFEEGRALLASNPEEFRRCVDTSLRRHFQVIKRLCDKGAKFWDYGNSFMASVFDAGEHSIARNGIDTSEGFIFPSYVEDIMGPLCFDFGYGPYRWVCLSGKDSDLHLTDQVAAEIIDPNRNTMDKDNHYWITHAEENNLVVGTKARILYADEEERIRIALHFNQLIREGKLGPVMIGRDHHDTGGTDSPFRETANIKDGSNRMADMAAHCFAGNAARGLTMVVLSNGGGVGVGKAFNSGNGIVLDGSEYIDTVIKSGLSWDVMGGVGRRNWARNENAMKTVRTWNEVHSEEGHITMPENIDDEMVNEIVQKKTAKIKITEDILMLNQFIRMMKAESIPESVIRTFCIYYNQLVKGERGIIPSSEINPPKEDNLLQYSALNDYRKQSMLKQIVVIKLNGGLGTSMGLSAAKSLLPVKGNMNFLDIIVRQILLLRVTTGYDVTLMFMNSFHTDDDTKKYLQKYPDLEKQSLPVTFQQNKFPRIRQDNLKPYDNPDPKKRWNPPGHGDLYTTLYCTGLLDKMIDAGFRYIFVSNSDNLGATIDPAIPSYMAANDLHFVMEVCHRTEMDKKGGHLCEDKNGQLMLREIAQCPENELSEFQNIGLYKYFNTNNLWIDLKALQWYLLTEDGTILLPLIVNPKVVDGTPIYQLETAMGAAISLFKNSRAVVVPRTRFSPVKKNNDLLAIWSDLYELNDQYHIVLKQGIEQVPTIELDERYYGNIDQMMEHFKDGVPSLIRCKELKITGDISFGEDVICEGKVSLYADHPVYIKSKILTGEIVFN